MTALALRQRGTSGKPQHLVNTLTAWESEIVLKVAMRLVTCLLLVTSLTPMAKVQAAEPTITKGKYQVKDSGIIARSQRSRELYWLDDQTVVAIGFLSKNTSTKVTAGDSKFGLLVWNTVSDRVTVQSGLGAISSLCVAPGYVRHQVQRDGTQFVRYGVIGRTREKVLDVQAMKDGILAVSPVSCREYNPKLLRQRYGRWSLPLLAPGEYLDQAAPYDGSSMRYFPEDGSTPVHLDEIPKRAIDPIPRYSSYLDSYLFAELRQRVATDVVQRFWILDRRGRVSEFTIPAGPWMTGATDALPAKSAWALISKAIELEGGHGAAGLYVARRGEVERVIIGYPHALAVAPSGCGVAVAIDVRVRAQNSSPTIMAIDLCKGETNYGPK